MQTVLVGLSGGVNSAVAALILKQQSCNVIGATMTIWGDRKLKTEVKKDACLNPCEAEDVESARNIAESISIPFYVFDCAKKYNDIVLKYFKDEYLKGYTPNPCVYCNALIKFGVLPEVARLSGLEFDKFATGHYAKIINGKLYQGTDKTKDQSYFLYRLTKEQLKNILLPLGDFTKNEIRKIAFQANLDVANKPDSQDFFAGDYNELLDVEDKIGNIIDTKGNVLGTHKGIWNYTVGQRKGLKISSTEPMYVLSLNKERNEVVVGALDKTFKKELVADRLNMFFDINSFDNLTAKIRSNQKPQAVEVEAGGLDKIRVKFNDYQKSIAKGQSVVLYDGEVVVGGGIISEVC